MPEPHSTRLPATDRGDRRSVMAQASDARPARFYDPARGRDEPPAVTAARERHRARNEQLEAAQRQRERNEALTAPQEAGDDAGEAGDSDA